MCPLQTLCALPKIFTVTEWVGFGGKKVQLKRKGKINWSSKGKKEKLLEMLKTLSQHET